MQRKTTSSRSSKKRAKKTAKKSAKKRVKKTAKKRAKKPTRRPAKKTAKKAAKKAVRKTAKKTAKKPRPRVSKKTAKKPSATTSKKTTPRASTPVSSKPRRKPSTVTPVKNPKQAAAGKGKRPILVPVDFSDHSAAALAYAAHLANRLSAPLAVLHVVHDPGDAPGYYRVKGRKKQLRRLEDVAGELFGEFMAKMIKRHPKRAELRKAERLLVTGLPVTRILEVAQRLEPKMVVMGSAGRTAMSRFLLGSKAEQLLRMCPFPVTIVKAPEKKK